MELSSGVHIPDGLLAAMTLLNEKPRQGVPTSNPAPHPGHTVRQSTTELGLSWSVASETRQSEVMGRFLSPDDPDNDRHLGDPQSLNLYSYGRNNPLKNIDPDGETCQTNSTGGDVYDDGDGKGCSQLDTTTVSATVTAQQGNVATSFALNGLMALSNMAGDYFAGLTGLRAYPNDQLSKDWTGTASNIGVNLAGLMVGPEGEAGEAINITERGLQHVMERHAAGGLKSAGKSLFNAGTDIKALVKAAESKAPETLPNGDLRFTVDAGQMVGVDRATGQATSKYTVVTDSSRNLITAHPGSYN